MFSYDMGRGYASFFEYMDRKTGWFINQGLTYVRGYLDGVGPVARFFARFWLPGTTRTTDINCAKDALKKL